jgi:plastocyanin
MFSVSKARAAKSLSAIAGIALFASACSGGGGGATTSATKGGFAFNPTTLTIDAGKAATITLKNPDAVVHDLQINGIPTPFKIEAQPGKDASGNVTIDKAGTYDFVCTQPGHEAAGMKGQITVK